MAFRSLMCSWLRSYPQGNAVYMSQPGGGSGYKCFDLMLCPLTTRYSKGLSSYLGTIISVQIYGIAQHAGCGANRPSVSMGAEPFQNMALVVGAAHSEIWPLPSKRFLVCREQLNTQ